MPKSTADVLGELLAEQRAADPARFAASVAAEAEVNNTKDATAATGCSRVLDLRRYEVLTRAIMRARAEIEVEHDVVANLLASARNVLDGEPPTGPKEAELNAASASSTRSLSVLDFVPVPLVRTPPGGAQSTAELFRRKRAQLAAARERLDRVAESMRAVCARERRFFAHEAHEFVAAGFAPQRVSARGDMAVNVAYDGTGVDLPSVVTIARFPELRADLGRAARAVPHRRVRICRTASAAPRAIEAVGAASANSVAAIAQKLRALRSDLFESELFHVMTDEARRRRDWAVGDTRLEAAHADLHVLFADADRRELAEPEAEADETGGATGLVLLEAYMRLLLLQRQASRSALARQQQEQPSILPSLGVAHAFAARCNQVRAVFVAVDARVRCPDCFAYSVDEADGEVRISATLEQELVCVVTVSASATTTIKTGRSSLALPVYQPADLQGVLEREAARTLMGAVQRELRTAILGDFPAVAAAMELDAASGAACFGLGACTSYAVRVDEFLALRVERRRQRRRPQQQQQQGSDAQNSVSSSKTNSPPEAAEGGAGTASEADSNDEDARLLARRDLFWKANAADVEASEFDLLVERTADWRHWLKEQISF